jgi:hypothetical protein
MSIANSLKEVLTTYRTGIHGCYAYESYLTRNGFRIMIDIHRVTFAH